MLQKRVALHGRSDLPLDPAAVLLARDLIDRVQYDTLGTITQWLQQLAHRSSCPTPAVRDTPRDRLNWDWMSPARVP